MALMEGPARLQSVAIRAAAENAASSAFPGRWVVDEMPSSQKRSSMRASRAPLGVCCFSAGEQSFTFLMFVCGRHFVAILSTPRTPAFGAEGGLQVVSTQTSSAGAWPARSLGMKRSCKTRLAELMSLMEIRLTRAAREDVARWEGMLQRRMGRNALCLRWWAVASVAAGGPCLCSDGCVPSRRQMDGVCLSLRWESVVLSIRSDPIRSARPLITRQWAAAAARASKTFASIT